MPQIKESKVSKASPSKKSNSSTPHPFPAVSLPDVGFLAAFPKKSSFDTGVLLISPAGTSEDGAKDEAGVKSGAKPAKKSAKTPEKTSKLTLGAEAAPLSAEERAFADYHLSQNPKFKGEHGQFLTLTMPIGSRFSRLILAGVATDKGVSEIESLGGTLCAHLQKLNAQSVVILSDSMAPLPSSSSTSPIISVLYGLLLGCYSFDGYKTIEKSKKTNSVTSVTVLSAAAKSLEKDFVDILNLAQSVFLVRDLVNSPPNKLYPASFADIIRKTLEPLGVQVQVFEKSALEKMKMGCLLAVGQASEFEPRLVVMSWPGAQLKGKKTATSKSLASKPLALVGKGITFDSGGLNVKPFEGMMDMKMDMAGAACVVGTMRALALRGCTVPVVGIVALAENSISDEATRPSDIVTSYSGKTVEILNTDAEGRLVLADALTYVQNTYDPKIVIDLATLTGAIMVALGLNYCGAFVNQDDLWSKIESAGAGSGEKIWRMPLDPSFRKEMDSEFADIKNIGSNGRMGGSCTGAAFLGEFIDAGRPWAHLDIAGVAMSKTKPTCPVPFGSGYGVKLLNDLIKYHYE